MDATRSAAVHVPIRTTYGIRPQAVMAVVRSSVFLPRPTLPHRRSVSPLCRPRHSPGPGRASSKTHDRPRWGGGRISSGPAGGPALGPVHYDIAFWSRPVGSAACKELTSSPKALEVRNVPGQHGEPIGSETWPIFSSRSEPCVASSRHAVRSVPDPWSQLQLPHRQS
jgi:hypothetical protein